MAEGVRRGSISERRLSFSDSKFHRRTSNHNLTVDIERARRRLEAGDVAANPADTCRLCPGHRDCDGPSQEQVIQEGKELFQNFLREEMQSRDLGAHLDLITPVQSPASGHKNPVWAKAGRELREMADEFSKTKERQRLRERAYRVDLVGLQYEQFTELLQELLVPPGAALSRRRVVGVFVVCADLLLRTLEEGQEGVFTPLLQWSTAFIAEHVALWVTRHGGWETVLAGSVEMVWKLMLAVAAVISAVCVYKWIKEHK